MQAELRLRRQRIQTLLSKLSGGQITVKVDSDQTSSDNISITFQATASLLEASVILRIWEQFLDIEDDVTLYAFKYHVLPNAAGSARAPHFRYECHPDVSDDPSEVEETVDDNDPDRDYRSIYEKNPHFHPDHTAIWPLNRLHFPFHHVERKKIIFALGQWIYLDLLKRYHRTRTRRFQGTALGEELRRLY